MEDWFKPSAYALILLMKEGYPCIFYGDYYGVSGNPPMHRGIIDNLLEIRKNHAFGEQNYYFDHPNTIGFTRVGDDDHPHSGVAVLISNGEDGDKVMNVGKQHAGETWKEATGNVEETVAIDEEGNGQFLVPRRQRGRLDSRKTLRRTPSRTRGWKTRNKLNDCPAGRQAGAGVEERPVPVPEHLSGTRVRPF